MRPRGRGCGCLGTLLAILVVLAVVFVVEYGGDYLLYAPWAYGFLGQPTLTGSWTGTMTTHSGGRYVVYLQLTRDRSRRGVALNSFGQADIDGHISWCARSSPSSTTTIFGIANRSASKITLDPGELRRPLPSLAPYELRGAWHGTTLLLHVQYQVAKKYGYSTVQTPVAVTFHKNGYSAYQAACARV